MPIQKYFCTIVLITMHERKKILHKMTNTMKKHTEFGILIYAFEVVCQGL
uniref:Uncharacterized protein n=1 Tax=Anguilla anguilla TaxID=7936 RepID=A0A0E9RY74_ANGAN